MAAEGESNGWILQLLVHWRKEEGVVVRGWGGGEVAPCFVSPKRQETFSALVYTLLDLPL